MATALRVAAVAAALGAGLLKRRPRRQVRYSRAHMKSIQLGIVGAGNMASALVRGLISSGRLAAAQIRVSDVSDAQCESFRQAHGVQSADSTPALVAWANVVLIAVKPQVVPSILPDLAAAYRKEQLILSIA